MTDWWDPTDQLSDGSPVMFITDDWPATPGYSIVMNEDGDSFEVPSDEVEVL